MKRHDEYRHREVETMTDAQLLFDRTQIRVSIECGVTHDYRRVLEARELEINKVLAARARATEAAQERIEHENRNATKLEKLWALIDAGTEQKIDAMATDEHYKDALDLARDFIRDGIRHSAGNLLAPARIVAAALVDMEDQLAQSRGLLVAMTRAARKWRDIARGESIDTSSILTRDQIGLLLGMLVTYGADTDVDPAIKTIHRVINAASAKFAKDHK